MTLHVLGQSNRLRLMSVQNIQCDVILLLNALSCTPANEIFKQITFKSLIYMYLFICSICWKVALMGGPRLRT